MDVITSHLNADFDSLASAMAAKKLYPGAVIVFPGSMEKKVRDFVDAFHPVEIRKVRDIVPEQVKRLIVVDTKHPDRIGPLRELLSRPEVKVHLYDHHPPTKEDLRGEREIVEVAGAASTIFTEILQKKRLPLTPLEATTLCLGIYQETGSLLFTSTMPRDLMAVAYLVKKGANLATVAEFLREEMSREEFSLLNRLIESLKEVVILGVRIKIGKAAMEGFGDVAHLAHQVMSMEDADAVVLLIGMDDKILMVARSRVAELDISAVLAEFGGGGHRTAASATIKDLPFEIIEEKLVAALEKHVRPAKIAADVMTKPVIVVQWNSSIRDAEAMMTRYGINVLPVVRSEEYRGILSREVVEKALFHGLGKNRCEDFATADAITVAPDRPVSEVEKDMIEHNQRFVAVLEGEKVVGAITRTDILRSIYEDMLRRGRVASRDTAGGEPASGFVRNVATLLRERLPFYLHKFLARAGDAADALDSGASLGGGSVRDLLRGEENLDIDIVVEGDGIAFARDMGKRLNAKVTAHRKFGTAQIIIREGSSLFAREGKAGDGREPLRAAPGRHPFKIDVATARTEYYASPAAMPTVETASIKRDLYRRDFTINTLAVRLNRKGFGQLLDFFGAQRDLKDKIIRVLHNLSFVEDPTRAFRAIRFSERFGFKITRHTENLIKFAIKASIFEKLSGSRIYDEMILIFNETDPVKALKRLGDYGLLKVIHSSLTYSPELDALLRSVHDTLTWFELLFLDEKYDKGMLYTMALLYRLSPEEREVALDRLAVPKPQRERITRGLRNVPEVVKKLPTDRPVPLYHLLAGCAVEEILFSMALAADSERKKAVSHYLLHLRNVRPLLKGEDLKEMGIPQGPVYSEIMRRVHDEKLVGRLTTKEEEQEFVREFLHPASGE
ncbi:MAG: CBS domain-containing protein [Thermodesulfovibrionales bacterium]